MLSMHMDTMKDGKTLSFRRQKGGTHADSQADALTRLCAQLHAVSSTHVRDKL